MKMSVCFCFMMLGSVLHLAAQSPAPPKPLSVEEISTMLRVHLDENSILQDLHSRRLNAPPTPAEISQLQQLGASDRLIATLQDQAFLATPEVSLEYEKRKLEAVRRAEQPPVRHPPRAQPASAPRHKIELTPRLRQAVQLSLAILEGDFMLESLRGLIPYYRNTVAYPQLRAEIANVAKQKAQFTEQLEELVDAMSPSERQELRKLAKLGHERELGLRQQRVAQLQELLSGASGSLPVAKKEQVREMIAKEEAAIADLEKQASVF